MDESPPARYGEARRRKTVFRKIRTLCTLFNLRCMVILVDDSNRQWIFKTHEEVPGTDQVRHLDQPTLNYTHKKTGY